MKFIVVIILAVGNCRLAYTWIDDNAATNSIDSDLMQKASRPFPYMVSVQSFDIRTNKSEHLCGGVIIDEEYVLTAAHCFVFQPHHVVVVGGSNTFTTQPANPNDRHYVNRLVVHQWFQPLTGPDIALLHVNRKFQFDGVHYDKIKFNIGSKYIYKDAYLIGWGAKTGLEKKPLRLLSFRTIESQVCRNKGFSYVTAKDICALSNKQGPCDGDSGGPLVNTEFNLVVGILSYGKQPCKSNEIYVFTDILHLTPWILSEMKDGHHKDGYEFNSI